MRLGRRPQAPTTVIQYGDSPLSQRAAIANGRYCHVMYKLLYPNIRVRTAPPVSVRVRTRVSVSFSLRILFCIVRIFAIADLNLQYIVMSSVCGVHGTMLIIHSCILSWQSLIKWNRLLWLNECAMDANDKPSSIKCQQDTVRLMVPWARTST